MTEAKDTVMEGNQIAACYGIKANTTHGILWEDARKAVDVEIATRQAEISFKAGMKEVVEFIEQNSENIYSNDTRYSSVQAIGKVLWQAQLKEWGIEIK